MNLLGAIGKRPCEKTLEKIMEEVNNRKMTAWVMRLITHFREGLKQILYVPDPAYLRRFTYEWKEQFCGKVRKRELPAAVESHLLACLVAYYRDHMNIIYNKEKSGLVEPF